MINLLFRFVLFCFAMVQIIFIFTVVPNIAGPIYSKRMTTLVIETLDFLIFYKNCLFRQKMWGAFAAQKCLHFLFLAKNVSATVFLSTVRLNKYSTNNFVKRTILWTTRPWISSKLSPSDLGFTVLTLNYMHSGHWTLWNGATLQRDE